MGKRGPARTPKATLKLRGTYREDRHGGPEVPEGAPSCPAWLSKEAKAEWNRIVPVLVRCVGVALIDRAILAAYCEAWGEYHEAVKVLAKEGNVYEVETQTGTVKRRHPLVDVKNRARADIKAFGSQLGLSPSARTGLKVDRVNEPDPDSIEKFFA